MCEKWAWISGWGIQPQRFQAAVEAALPDASHTVVAPSPDAVESVLHAGATHIGGYSLGSLLILNALDRIPAETEVLCMAPILAFCEEDQMGGTTPRASLNLLQAKLAKNPKAALKLFYRMVNLPDEPLDVLPYPDATLTWGLEQLARLQAGASNLGRVTAIIGQDDRLLDAQKISSFFERKSLIDSQHDYKALCTKLCALTT